MTFYSVHQFTDAKLCWNPQPMQDLFLESWTLRASQGTQSRRYFSIFPPVHTRSWGVVHHRFNVSCSGTLQTVSIRLYSMLPDYDARAFHSHSLKCLLYSLNGVWRMKMCAPTKHTPAATLAHLLHHAGNNNANKTCPTQIIQFQPGEYEKHENIQ